MAGTCDVDTTRSTILLRRVGWCRRIACRVLATCSGKENFSFGRIFVSEWGIDKTRHGLGQKCRWRIDGNILQDGRVVRFDFGSWRVDLSTLLAISFVDHRGIGSQHISCVMKAIALIVRFKSETSKLRTKNCRYKLCWLTETLTSELAVGSSIAHQMTHNCNKRLNAN